MKRQTLLKITNGVLAALMTTQAASGLLHARLSADTFELVHEHGAYLLIAAVVVHVVLNRAWIRSAFSRHKTQAD